MLCTCTQHFAQNANASYKAGGLRGHTGVDVTCGYHSQVYALFSGLIVKVIDNKTSFAYDGSHYTMTSQLVDDGIECFEWQVGHLDTATYPGHYVTKGDLTGYESNHGTVYAAINGVVQLVTEQMRLGGVTAGAHRHYQKRGLIPVKSTTPGALYLSGQTMTPWYNPDKQCYYQYAEPNNGYAGCLNPQKPVFARYLTPGATGYDVFILQRILRKGGFLMADPTGFFGIKTLAALMAWQKANGLTPAPICGPKSMQLALKQTSPLPDLLS